MSSIMRRRSGFISAIGATSWFRLLDGEMATERGPVSQGYTPERQRVRRQNPSQLD
jgi:hypothetical protein